MHIAIIDESIDIQNNLRNELLKSFPKSAIKCYSECLLSLLQDNFDIIFLEVKLNDKTNFEYGEKICFSTPKTILVYISNTNDLVYKCLGQECFFFLRKSMIIEDLVVFLKKYRYIQEKSSVLYIKYNKHVLEIIQNDIIIIHSSGNKVMIVTTYATYTVYITLKKIMRLLNPLLFHRFNSFTILNMNHVMRYCNEYISLTNGDKISYTRGSKQLFVNAFTTYRKAIYKDNI